MSAEIVYYSDSGAGENGNNWDDGDDGLQALMHAAADADARDNEEALIKENEISDNENPEPPPPEIPPPKVSIPKTTAIKTSPVKSSPIKRKHESSRERPSYHESVQISSGSRKRHHDEEELSERRLKTNEGSFVEKSEGHANVVAAHYNTLKEKGLDERLKSRIFYMRNFNNWIKSMLINEYLNKVKDGMKHNSPIRVMDMCCGKGGDLLKWRKGNISHLICTDIASVSLEQCESRYKEMCIRSARERNAGRVYKAEFIPADCTRVHLRKRYEDPSIKLDLVSCQFAFHYSFESLPQAECMLRNAAECLQPGGYLIGTIPDANDIMARQRKANSKLFGNDVYQIIFLSNPELPPLFGAKYNFHLDGVVDCPEFLVHFPLFVKLARQHGLELVKMERFDDFYHRMKSEGSSLLQKMQSLETYPPFEGTPLLGSSQDDYKHAELEERSNGRDSKIGTLSKSEWEAACK